MNHVIALWSDHALCDLHSWCGKIKSIPPSVNIRNAPSGIFLPIAVHSQCQPGIPLLTGWASVLCSGCAHFHRAKSAGLLLSLWPSSSRGVQHIVQVAAGQFAVMMVFVVFCYIEINGTFFHKHNVSEFLLPVLSVQWYGLMHVAHYFGWKYIQGFITCGSDW